MLKERRDIFKALLFIADMGTLTAAFYLAYVGRRSLGEFVPFVYLAGYVPVSYLIWGGCLYSFGMYASLRFKTIGGILRGVRNVAAVSLLIFGALLYVAKGPYLSRMFILMFFAFSWVLISAERIMAIRALRFFRKRGYNYRNVLIVGTGRRAQRFINNIHGHAEWGLRIIGLIDADDGSVGNQKWGYPILGTFNEFTDILHRQVVDEVLIIVPYSLLSKVESAIRQCDIEGIKVQLAVDYFELRCAKVKQTDSYGLPLLTYESTPDSFWSLALKRLLDIAVSSLVLLFFSPLYLLIAILIKATSPGPVIFRQVRCGLNNREFILYKFRTMVEDAEQRLSQVLARNEMNGPVFKIKNDPRLTRVGAFLRHTSLDELPQFWNVLKGDMSLVGPRPPLPQEVSRYESWHRRRLTMRPGITCLWQINGRNTITDFNKWTTLDLYYIDHWSFLMDCKILLKTIPTVFSGKGAH